MDIISNRCLIMEKGNDSLIFNEKGTNATVAYFSRFEAYKYCFAICLGFPHEHFDPFLDAADHKDYPWKGDAATVHW